MWAHVELMWTHVGLMWTHVELMWTHDGLMWAHVELMWTHVGLMWTHVELMWTHVDLMWSCCGLRWDDYFPPLALSPSSSSWARLPKPGPRTYGEVRRRGGRPSEAQAWLAQPPAIKFIKSVKFVKPRFARARRPEEGLTNLTDLMNLMALMGPTAAPLFVNQPHCNGRGICGPAPPLLKPILKHSPRPSRASSPSSSSSRVSPGPEGRKRA